MALSLGPLLRYPGAVTPLPCWLVSSPCYPLAFLPGLQQVGGRQMINSTVATLGKRLGPKPLRESEELSVPLCRPSKDPTGD